MAALKRLEKVLENFPSRSVPFRSVRKVPPRESAGQVLAIKVNERNSIEVNEQQQTDNSLTLHTLPRCGGDAVSGVRP